MEDLLGSKLAEFLDTDYQYSLNQIPTSTRPHLYKGPSVTKTDSQSDGMYMCTWPVCFFSFLFCYLLFFKDKLTESEEKTVAFGKQLPPHPIKGGWCIAEYLTYDW